MEETNRPAEWLTPQQLGEKLGYSRRTIRRKMHDGTWRKGEHWFKRQGSRALFSWPRIVEWLTLAEEPPRADVGLAYDADIPPGRRRRLPSLRNKGRVGRNGATGAEEADRAAGGVPGADTTDVAARGE